jgi:hypothetical protein
MVLSPKSVGQDKRVGVAVSDHEADGPVASEERPIRSEHYG